MKQNLVKTPDDCSCGFCTDAPQLCDCAICKECRDEQAALIGLHGVDNDDEVQE